MRGVGGEHPHVAVHALRPNAAVIGRYRQRARTAHARVAHVRVNLPTAGAPRGERATTRVTHTHTRARASTLHLAPVRVDARVEVTELRHAPRGAEPAHRTRRVDAGQAREPELAHCVPPVVEQVHQPLALVLGQRAAWLDAPLGVVALQLARVPRVRHESERAEGGGSGT